MPNLRREAAGRAQAAAVMDGLTAARIGLQLAAERSAVEDAYRKILESVLGPDLTPGTEETPARAARAIAEMTSGYKTDIAGLFKTFDGEGYDEMVCVPDIAFSSLCEHHILPFSGHAHVVYIANGKVVGLSKVARLVDAFANRLQQQERLGMQIADAMEEHLDPVGVLVVISASHSCSCNRGVKKSGMKMGTGVARGAIRDVAATRAEAYALIAQTSARP